MVVTRSKERNKGIPTCQVVAVLDGVTKERAFEKRPEEVEGRNREAIWWKSISGRGNSKCKGPGVSVKTSPGPHGWSGGTKGLSGRRKERRIEGALAHGRP